MVGTPGNDPDSTHFQCVAMTSLAQFPILKYSS